MENGGGTLNVLPVATLELKTDFTQSVADAIGQYKTSRFYELAKVADAAGA
jgi:type I site-specific restriction-modification system R (restriction) subunit